MAQLPNGQGLGAMADPDYFKPPAFIRNLPGLTGPAGIAQYVPGAQVPGKVAAAYQEGGLGAAVGQAGRGVVETASDIARPYAHAAAPWMDAGAQALKTAVTGDASPIPNNVNALISGGAADSPPPKAASSAKDAALMALGKDSVDQASDSPGAQLSPGYRVNTGPSGNTGDTTAWNHMVDQLTGMTGMSREQTAKVLSQPLPTDSKAGGEAAMRTTDGAPKRLNYGYGSEIIGSGMTDPNGLNVGQSGTNGMNAGPQRMNSFSGVGRAPSSTAGAAGDAFDQAHAHIMDLMSQAEAKRKAGDGLGAKSLENHAARLGALFTGLSEHAYRTGTLAHQGRVTNLAEQQAIAGIQIDRQIAQALKDKDPETAARLSAIKRGAPPFSKKSVMPGTYGIDEYSPEDTREAYPYFKATAPQ